MAFSRAGTAGGAGFWGARRHAALWKLKCDVSSTISRMPKALPPLSQTGPDTGPLPASYEAGLQELERLVNELESGQLPLDQLLGSYQRGAALLGFCRDRLQAVEDQIKVLDAGHLKAWSAE